MQPTAVKFVYTSVSKKFIPQLKLHLYIAGKSQPVAKILNGTRPGIQIAKNSLQALSWCVVIRGLVQAQEDLWDLLLTREVF